MEETQAGVGPVRPKSTMVPLTEQGKEREETEQR